MTGHAESDAEPETTGVEAAEDEGKDEGKDEDKGEDKGEDEDKDEDEDLYEDARRARWTATMTGVLLALMGLTAASMRVGGGVAAVVPAAYGSGSVVCVFAGALGARGRTRWALWLMILGTMVMALGDQFD